MPPVEPTIARVILDTPLPQLDRLLDYRIPAGMEGVVPGVRVSVPLRTANRMTQGFVVELATQQEHPGPLSDLEAVVSSAEVLRPEVWRLVRAVADRAAGSAIDVLRLAIPKRQVRVEKAWLAARAAGRAEPPPLEREAPVVPGYATGEVDALLAGGRAALEVDPGVERAGEVWVGRWALALAALAARTVTRGASAILVAPDHRDIRQLEAALGELLPADRIVRFDAGQPDADRYRGMLRAMGEEPVVVLGGRSAVYAPASRLGLLAVWNDGDPLLAEPLTPYVHARDAALIRQEQQGGALVFAGHTRTTEVERLAELGWLSRLAPERPRRARVVSTANAAGAPDDAHARIPGIAWREAAAAVATGPVLVQVARPGYSPGLRCAECGTAARCRRCGGPLRQQRAGGAPSCLWCGVEETHWRCTECGSSRLTRVGAGSTRTAEELGRAFPGARVVVADGERRVLEVDERPALVVATRGAEPVAAGGYRAVLLLDGERMVARETLRIAEDCLRWWSDAAALAADGAPVMLVGVGGRLATALSTGNVGAFARAELADRRALGFPPAARVATLEGLPDAVAAARRALPPEAAVLAERVADGRARAIIRFDYAHGAEVARAVRGEIVRQAATRRKPIPGAARPGRAPLPLRARFDDPEPFDEL
ncbi:primosomal protein N' family DNA-binding protein [Protaetiibacter intestinalis]|uniref:Primosomal protein N n=1 Tax=Protaetiibacter intestinalis TaxID=2419774 RepID=A0A387B9N6_9MICO|nr:primosomal protein N' [Protaetiibacter intestinalis]AYF99097.1 primosomal protein N' [Protaetiibacter intestinalis]